MMIAIENPDDQSTSFKEKAKHTLRVKVLVRNLLRQPTATFLGRSHVTILGSELAFKEPGTHL